MALNLTGLNTASFFPPATRQLLGNGIQQALQATSLFGQSSSSGGGGLSNFSGKSGNPFNLLGNGSLNNIDPFTAVSLATAIGGLPTQTQSSTQSPAAALLGTTNLNNINPINAVALATALAGPLLGSANQGLGGMSGMGGLLA